MMSDMFSADILRRRKVQKVPLNVCPYCHEQQVSHWSGSGVHFKLKIDNPCFKRNEKLLFGETISFIKFHSKNGQTYLRPVLLIPGVYSLFSSTDSILDDDIRRTPILNI